MPAGRSRRGVPLLLLLSLTHPAVAEQLQLEIIPLRHRLVAEMLPVLQPLLAPGGTISGLNNQIIVRTTPRNLEEIRQVLQQTDHSARRFKIYVRQRTAGNTASAGAGIAGSYGGDQGVQLRYRSYSTRGRDDTDTLHFVQAVEGQPAFISTGQSVPQQNQQLQYGPNGVYVEQSSSYRDVDSGFDVVAQGVGDQITLTIGPRQMRMTADGNGVVNTGSARTTIRGRLGEWLDLGGASQDFEETGTGYTRSTRRRGTQVHGIEVLVEEVP